MVRALLALGTYRVSATSFGKVSGSSCCSTSDSLGNTRTFPGLAVCALAALALSCSETINILAPPDPDVFFADVSALSRLIYVVLSPWARSKRISPCLCTQEYLRAARRGELLSSGQAEFNTRSTGFAPRLSDKLCWHTDVAAPETIKNSFRFRLMIRQ